MGPAEREARKALSRLRRALEKSGRELDSLSAAIRHAEGPDFPADVYQEARSHLQALLAFTDQESERLEEKLLYAGGLEPGRVRRSSQR